MGQIEENLMRTLRAEKRQPTSEEHQVIANWIQRHRKLRRLFADTQLDRILPSLLKAGALTPHVIEPDQHINHLLTTSVCRVTEYAQNVPRLIEDKAFFCCWSLIRSWIETVTFLCAIERNPNPQKLAEKILDPSLKNKTPAQLLKACRNQTHPASLDIGVFKNVFLGGLPHLVSFDEDLMKAIHQTDHLDYGAIELAERGVLYKDETIGYELDREDPGYTIIMNWISATLALETRAHIQLLIAAGRLVD